MSADEFALRWHRIVPGGISFENVALGNALAGAVTLNADIGIVTSEALATPPNGDYVLTVTNANIAADDMVLATARKGTSTNGRLRIEEIDPGAGQVVIRVTNLIGGGGPLNGTIKIGFLVLKTT